MRRSTGVENQRARRTESVLIARLCDINSASDENKVRDFVSMPRDFAIRNGCIEFGENERPRFKMTAGIAEEASIRQREG